MIKTVKRKRWQVPGNGNPFDSKLEDWKGSKMSERSIGVLEFIAENKDINENDFVEKIVPFLNKKYNHESNESNKKHFYRPLEFIGLIRNIDGNLSLSIDGNNFLREIHQENYKDAYNFYILQLLKTSYPNTATKSIELSLFPFRIIFKLLLKNKIPKSWFINKIPYITELNNIYNLENIEENDYMKWKTWVLSYLIKWEILEEDDEGFIKIGDFKRDFIKTFVDEMKFEDMFFDTDFELFNNIKII